MGVRLKLVDVCVLDGRLTSDVSDALQEGEEEYQKMHSQWVMKGQAADQEKHK